MNGGEKKIARVESTLKLRIENLASGDAKSTESYDLATGQLLDAVEDSSFTNPESDQVVRSHNEFHAD